MKNLMNIGITRRTLLTGAAIISAAAIAVIKSFPANAKSSVVKTVTSKLSFKVNGKRQELEVDTRTTLLDALREDLHLNGTKKGCDHGQCGACTVLVNNRRINSCLSLALQHDGDEIMTIEGLGTPDNLHPMQQAFIKHDGFQCGYCTPGQICSALGVLEEIKADIPSHVSSDLLSKSQITNMELRERMSGNICRCGAYSNIIDAITEVSEKTI